VKGEKYFVSLPWLFGVLKIVIARA